MLIFQSTWPQLDISSSSYQSYSIIALLGSAPFLQPKAVFVWYMNITTLNDACKATHSNCSHLHNHDC